MSEKLRELTDEEKAIFYDLQEWIGTQIKGLEEDTIRNKDRTAMIYVSEWDLWPKDVEVKLCLTKFLETDNSATYGIGIIRGDDWCDTIFGMDIRGFRMEDVTDIFGRVLLTVLGYLTE